MTRVPWHLEEVSNKNSETLTILHCSMNPLAQLVSKTKYRIMSVETPMTSPIVLRESISLNEWNQLKQDFPNEEEKEFESVTHDLTNTKWHISMYPNGYLESSKDKLSVYLELETADGVLEVN